MWKGLSLSLVFFLLLNFVQSETDEKEEKVKQEWCYEDNCYDVLGLDQTVDHRTIKTRYNNLSLDYHPDRNPNQTQGDREKYVKINRAYEILSDSKLRSEYDQYLRIRTSMDSPKEHPIVVIGLLYGLSVLIVLQYKKQYYRNVRKGILEDPLVQKYFQNEGLELNNSKKSNKIKKNKKTRQNGPDNSVNSGSSLLTSVDPTVAKSPYDDISDEQINKAIQHLKLNVPQWNAQKPQPDWTDAFWQIPVSLSHFAKLLFFQLRWQYQYNLMKQELSESDGHILCRTHFGLTEAQWDELDDTKKQSYLSKPGKWKQKKPQPEKKHQKQN